MKRITLLTTGIILLLLCLACRKEHVAPVNQLLKDLFCFKIGSEWMYYDSVSHTTQRMVVTNYETFKSAPKSKRKTYNFVEAIIMDITVENVTQLTSIKGETNFDGSSEKYDYDGGASIFTPASTKLLIRCDATTNFNPPATYLNTYVINETNYSDVYVFNKDNITYYVSKYIGFIRCIKDNKYDLVLINKNIRQ